MTYPSVYTIRHVLTKEECSSIIQTCKPFLQQSTIGTSQDDEVVDQSIRSNKSVMITPDDDRFVNIQPLVRKVIESFITATTKAFQYEVSHVEPIQFTEYLEGDFYDWHMDASTQTPRFSSASLCLSDPSTFQGGTLTFRDVVNQEDNKQLSVPLSHGELAVFPSLLIHSIKPVKAGKRYVLVLWSPLVNKEIQEQQTTTTAQPTQPNTPQAPQPIVF